MTNSDAGIVYLVGAGPGDPDLLGQRALSLLQQCDWVLYDALVDQEILGLIPEHVEREYVGKRAKQPSTRQTRINQRLVSLAQEGKAVVRLKGGDPMLFSRGGEEISALKSAGIPFEIVAAVPSPIALSAYAGVPLTHRDFASSVTFVTGTNRHGMALPENEWAAYAQCSGTLCVLMGLRQMSKITSLLQKHGKSANTPAMAVQWVARPEQRVVEATLATLAEAVSDKGLGAPCLIVIGEVVRLRQSHDWYRHKPLFGEGVIVTRAAHQARRFGDSLRRAGARPLYFPSIRIEPKLRTPEVAKALDQLHEYDWLLLTSPNGSQQLLQAWADRGQDARALGKAKIAAIGPGTARPLQEKAIAVDGIAPKHVGEGLCEYLLAREPKPKRALLLRAAEARSVIVDTLEAAGWQVDVVASYETHPSTPANVEMLESWVADGRAKWLTFTSSSTVKHFVGAVGKERAAALSQELRVASIGPITTATAKELGLNVTTTAKVHTVAGLLAAMAEHPKA